MLSECLTLRRFFAGVVKLADTPDLGSGAERCVGSTPSARTSSEHIITPRVIFQSFISFFTSGMKVVLEPIADQHGIFSISVSKEDFLPKVNSELKKIKKSAHIKGFRQGAVPDAMVQKLYGEEMKADILQKLVNQTIQDYQKTNDVHFLGDLIEVPQGNQSIQNDPIEFKFEVGIAPKPDVSKIIEHLDILKFNVVIPEDRIDEEIEHLRKKMGESLETEDPVQKDDLIEIEAAEWEGDDRKEGGWSMQFPVSLNEYAHEKFQSLVLGLRKSDHFYFNIREVESNLSDKDVDKYLLKLPENHPEFQRPGDHYKGTLIKVLRRIPAELTEEFYKKAFGPTTQISNEEELRSNLRNSLQQYFDKECDKLLDIELVKKIVKVSNLKYPDEFLLKWLKASYDEWAKKEAHDVEHEYYHFKEGMSWKLIREKIADEQQFNITYEEISSIVISELKNQYPGIQLSDDHWNEFAKRSLGNKEKAMHYYIEAQNQKVLEWIKKQIEVREETITLDAFREKIKQINEHHHHH